MAALALLMVGCAEETYTPTATGPDVGGGTNSAPGASSGPEPSTPPNSSPNVNVAPTLSSTPSNETAGVPSTSAPTDNELPAPDPAPTPDPSPETPTNEPEVVAAGGSSGASAETPGGGGAGGSSGSAATQDPQGIGGGPSREPMDPARSSGCGQTAELTHGEWSPQPDVTIAGTPRQWAVRLPDDYDLERAYPLVVLLHGCTSGTNNVPMDRDYGADAVYVRGTGLESNTCWDASPNGPNPEFFDAMVDGAAGMACVDEGRIFAAGYSSGSWLISALACVRGDRLRAVGTVAGGNALFGNANCNGTVAQIFIHDQNDTENPWSNHESAMNRLLEVNGCSPDNPVPEAPEPCVRYQGCEENPVKFCPTTGRGHDRQDNYAPSAMWEFFSEF